MAESGERKLTEQDLRNAERLVAVETHVQHINTVLIRLEAAVVGTNAAIYNTVNNAMADSNKKTELIVLELTKRFETAIASQERVANIQSAAQDRITGIQAAEVNAKVALIAPLRDKIMQWSGAIALIVAMSAVIVWVLTRILPAGIRP